MLLCDKRRAESTHKSCNVGTDCINARDLLECTEYGFVVERTALYYDVATEILCVRKFYYFVKCIFDYGICKSCRNIGDRCPFFLRLLYVGVHEYGTACTEVNGMRCKQSLICKTCRSKSERYCIVFDE